MGTAQISEQTLLFVWKAKVCRASHVGERDRGRCISCIFLGCQGPKAQPGPAPSVTWVTRHRVVEVEVHPPLEEGDVHPKQLLSPSSLTD